jgi:hypothetical protein
LQTSTVTSCVPDLYTIQINEVFLRLGTYLLVFVISVGGIVVPTKPALAAAVSAAQTGKPKPQAPTSVKVWVNLKSGVYHCPGTRWYGATKSGQYMTEKEATSAGNRPAYGRACS